MASVLNGRCDRNTYGVDHMVRTLIAVIVALSLTASALAQPTPNTLDTVFAQSHGQSKVLHPLGVKSSTLSAPLAQSCCKICTVGKACGNTCISRDKTCHVGPGCACDG